MATYTIHSNALSGEYKNATTGETVTFTNETYHPGLLQYGISRFKVTFTNDNGDSVTQEHEVHAVDSQEVDRQLKETLAAYNNRIVNTDTPTLTTDVGMSLDAPYLAPIEEVQP